MPTFQVTCVSEAQITPALSTDRVLEIGYELQALLLLMEYVAGMERRAAEVFGQRSALAARLDELAAKIRSGSTNG